MSLGIAPKEYCAQPVSMVISVLQNLRPKTSKARESWFLRAKSKTAPHLLCRRTVAILKHLSMGTSKDTQLQRQLASGFLKEATKPACEHSTERRFASVLTSHPLRSVCRVRVASESGHVFSSEARQNSHFRPQHRHTKTNFTQTNKFQPWIWNTQEARTATKK